MYRVNFTLVLEDLAYFVRDVGEFLRDFHQLQQNTDGVGSSHRPEVFV